MADRAALDRLRENHLNVARRSAKYLEDVAGDMRLALDAGRVPERRKIVGAAVDLDRSLEVLAAIGEAVKICTEARTGDGD